MGCQLQNVTVGRESDTPGLRQAGDMVDLDYSPFFVDRVEDAVPPGPQAPQIRRSVRERLRRPRLIGELADRVPERRDTDRIVAEEARCLVSRRSEAAANFGAGIRPRLDRRGGPTATLIESFIY